MADDGDDLDDLFSFGAPPAPVAIPSPAPPPSGATRASPRVDRDLDDFDGRSTPAAAQAARLLALDGPSPASIARRLSSAPYPEEDDFEFIGWIEATGASPEAPRDGGGPPPPRAHSRPTAAAEARALDRARLTAYYRAHNPRRIDAVDRILAMFEGRTEALNEKLAIKVRGALRRGVVGMRHATGGLGKWARAICRSRRPITGSKGGGGAGVRRVRRENIRQSLVLGGRGGTSRRK